MPLLLLLFVNVMLFRDKLLVIPSVEDCVRDWTIQDNDEFLSDYVRPQGIRYSFGFGLFDIYNSLKGTCILDRIGNVNYSKEEMQIMYYIRTHLDNLYRNFYVKIFDNSNIENNIKVQSSLTERETEIADLLSKGVTPSQISTKLYISQTTVYKHISHIHAKLNVSNRQELILKLLHN